MSRITVLVAGLLLAVTCVAAGQDIDDLRKQKLETARDGFTTQWKLYREAGQGAFDKLYLWSLRCLEAAKEADPKGDAVPHLQAHLDRMRELERILETQFKVGQGNKADLLTAIYYRLDAQIMLAQAKAKKKG